MIISLLVDEIQKKFVKIFYYKNLQNSELFITEKDG